MTGANAGGGPANLRSAFAKWLPRAYSPRQPRAGRRCWPPVAQSVNPNRLFHLALVLFAGLLARPTPTVAAVLRVRAGATNATPDGLSWSSAFTSPRPALAAARRGDEIWVAAGVYTGAVTLPAGVACFGGFTGSEGTRAERNFNTNYSILDGLLQTNLLTVTKGATNDTRLDGFVLRNGFAALGAALRINGGAPVIANNQFFGNNATILGNAIFLEGGTTAVITNNHFVENGLQLGVPPTGGGAIGMTAASPRIEGNSFVGNRARDGGAIYCVVGGGEVTRNWFLNNEAWINGGGVACFAAATRVTHNHFLGNHALQRGGGVATTDGSTALVFNNLFVRNRAAGQLSEPNGGGGVFVDATSAATVLNNTLVENLAPVGGIFCLSRTANLVNNLVANGSSGIGGVTGLRLRRNNVFNNGGTNYVGLADATGTGGNISADPRFAGEPRRGIANLLPESPCRNAGETNAAHAGATDLDGQPRTQSAAVDIGADEIDGVTREFAPPAYYVSPDGSLGNDGRSWATAVSSVQWALNLAARTGGEVWVRRGTYAENLAVRAFTDLFGGFAGTETSRAQRDWRLQETVLDGGERGTTVNVFGLAAGETLDGFTVRGGAAAAGGGALISGEVRVLNNRFEFNRAASPASATAARGGGGLFSNGGNPLIANNTFTRNLAFSRSPGVPADGGALKVVAGAPVIINNVFRGNYATNSAASGEAFGGAVHLANAARPLLANNTFVGNFARRGEATDGTGGAIYSALDTNAPAGSPRLLNNLIAYNGSGLQVATGPTPELRHNLVWGNAHGDYGLTADPTGSNGNRRADPRLASPFMEPHLAADSPARDAGDPAVVQPGWLDLDGGDRVAGAAVDIGADEFTGTAPGLPQPIFFVRTDGADTNAGTTWETAKKTIQAALDQAAITGGEVWVRTGTFREHLRVAPFTHLVGGFTGDETNRLQRRLPDNLTVLDGQNSSQSPVVTFNTVDDRGSLDGFRIQNGAFLAGAGVAVTGSPRIERNLIVRNDTSGNGGGLFCNFGSPRIANNVFAVNSADATGTNSGRGGALFLDPPAGHRQVVTHNDFLDNSATNGGAAIFLGTNATFVVTDNIFASNTSGVAGTNATVTLERNCMFENEGADYAGVGPGAGSLVADPGFVNWRNLRFHLRADSPCIDAGSPVDAADELDLFLGQRRIGAATDIGAAEFNASPEAPFPVTLTSPAPGSRQPGPGVIQLTVDLGGTTNLPALVEYVSATGVVATATSAPFSATVNNLALGDHTLYALAIMADGALGRSGTNAFRVATPLPTVTFPSLLNGRIHEAPFTLNLVVQWAKVGGQVVSLDLFTNGIPLLAATNLPPAQGATNVSLPDLPVGEYSVRAEVTDNLGDRGTNAVNFSVRLAPLPALLSQPELQADGGLRIALTGPTEGAVYVLEHSTNLFIWRPLRTNDGGLATHWLVPAPLTNQTEFFRTRGLYP